MLPRLSLPLLPQLAPQTLSRPPLKLLTLDASDDDGPRQRRSGALGKPTSHPLALEQAAAKRASKDFARIRSKVESFLAANKDATNATKLLAGLKAELDKLASSKAQRDWAAQQVVDIARFNAQQLTRSVGIKVPDLLDANTQRRLIAQSLAGVRGVPREVVTRIAPAVRTAIETGERGKAFEVEVSAKLELSHQEARKVAIGTVIRTNSTLTEERHKALGVTEYVWRSSPDRHTRAWHRKLNGKRCKYAAPPIGGGGGPYDAGNPGSADRCRCQAIPVIPERAKTAPQLPAAQKPAPKSVKAKRPERVTSWLDKGLAEVPVPQSGMRAESLAYLRKGGAAAQSLPVTINVYADGTTRIVDGRHRITVAREQGLKHLDNVTVRFLGKREGVLHEFVGRVPL